MSRAWTDFGGILPRSTETSGRTIRMILWEPPTLWRRPSPTAKSRRRQRRSSTRNLNSRRTGYKWRLQRVPVLLFSKSNQISLQSILYEWFTLKIHDYVRQDTRIHWSSFQSITIFFISSNRVGILIGVTETTKIKLILPLLSMTNLSLKSRKIRNY